MPRARRPAMQVTFLRHAGNFFAARSPRHISRARREGPENRIETLHHSRLSADHLAIAAFESPDASACANVAVVNPFRGKLLRAANVVDVIRISTIDNHIVSLKF